MVKIPRACTPFFFLFLRASFSDQSIHTSAHTRTHGRSFTRVSFQRRRGLSRPTRISNEPPCRRRGRLETRGGATRHRRDTRRPREGARQTKTVRGRDRILNSAARRREQRIDRCVLDERLSTIRKTMITEGNVTYRKQRTITRVVTEITTNLDKTGVNRLKYIIHTLVKVKRLFHAKIHWTLDDLTPRKTTTVFPEKSRLSVIDGNEDGKQSSPARLPSLSSRGKDEVDAGNDKSQDEKAFLGWLDGESFIEDIAAHGVGGHVRGNRSLEDAPPSTRSAASSPTSLD